VVCGEHKTAHLFEKQRRAFLRCRGCGLVRVDPLPEPEELSRYYDRAHREGSYSTFVSAQEVRELIAKHRLSAVGSLVKRGRWLDLGCSSGDLVAAVQAAGFEAEGLDLSAEAVGRAKARGLTVGCLPVEAFEPAHAFETISAFDLLEHLLDPRGFLRRVRGWLTADGRLLLTMPDVRSVYPRLLMRRHWFYYWPDEHLFYFDRSTITRLLEEEGFEVMRLSRATKPLTLDYAARSLELFNRRLGRLVRCGADALPESLLKRPWPVYLGEMLVVARPSPRR
jgi:2-polyprenyl-3-methyl-5-hydroxy-6-metoxy-1,4-benzoquinol methylase